MLSSGQQSSDGAKHNIAMKPVSSIDESSQSLPQQPTPIPSHSPSADLASLSGSVHHQITAEKAQPRNIASSINNSHKESDDPKQSILGAFLPHVFILPSADTEELVRLKGIYGGLTGLLRPFGETIHGHVVTRDSAGASRDLTNFGVHFVPFPRDVRNWPVETLNPKSSTIIDFRDDVNQSEVSGTASTSAPGHLDTLDEVLQSYFRRSDIDNSISQARKEDVADRLRQPLPYYSLYLRKLLAGRSLVAHETFTHPVACLIAISSQSSNPIETLRDLYDATRIGSKRIPPWVSNEFLRYYLLIHDEDHDDIARTTALFDQMKKHFGLHCHLLRIRSMECDTHDEDGTELPSCDWFSAAEELEVIRRKDQNHGVDEFRQFIFDADFSAIRNFVREMVTQSIIPFMEGRVTAWNDQVASRRRGISGRFMSLSKRWNAFGSGRSSKTASAGSTSSNYDPNLGVYLPETPEATMQRLADYAFMLRDWKLSSSTYDLLRTDFADDKAWRHNALANEMTVLGLLLSSQRIASRSGTEPIDQMLDGASYSYLSRCSDPIGATRCLVLAIELYSDHGDTGLREATKWANRLLEISVLSPLCQCIVSEQVARSYQFRAGLGSVLWSSQHRKAAFWELLTADLWLQLEKISNARECLGNAKSLYATATGSDRTPPFPAMLDLLDEIQRRSASNDDNSALTNFIDETDGVINEEEEDLSQHADGNKHTHRRSVGFQPNGVEAVSLYQRIHAKSDDVDDGFT